MSFSAALAVGFSETLLYFIVHHPAVIFIRFGEQRAMGFSILLIIITVERMFATGS